VPETTKVSPSSTARVRNEARSDPESGSLIPMHHAAVPLTMSGRNRFRCSSVPKARSEGPICRSQNHVAAMGAPAAIIAS
jgi:hypothetical protein